MKNSFINVKDTIHYIPLFDIKFKVSNFYKNIISDNYKYIIVIIFFISLFFGGKIVVWTLAPLLVYLIFELLKNKISFNKNLPNILLVVLYFLHVISLFYSKNTDVALFDLQVKLSLVIFPIIFLFIKDTILFNRKKIAEIFVFSSIIISILLISNLLINYFNDYSLLYYTEYSIYLHPSYFALYLDFSIVLAVYLISKTKNKLLITFYLSAISLFLLNIYFSDSKSGYLATILVLMYIVFYYGLRKSRVITLSSILIILIASFFVLKNNPRFQTTFNILSKYENVIENPSYKNSSTSMRILAWDASAKLIKENLIFGVGAGDIKQELNKKYEELNYDYLAKYNLNSHNQFIETWLGQGILGFVLLLLVFIIPFISAIKRKNIILQAFLLLMFINFLFESMLNTQAGTIFFGFFYSFLVVTNDKK